MNFLSFFLFFINPPLSAHAVSSRVYFYGNFFQPGSEWDGQLAIGRKASIYWYRDLAHHSPNSHKGGGQKCEIWRRFQNNSTLCSRAPAFENAAR